MGISKGTMEERSSKGNNGNQQGNNGRGSQKEMTETSKGTTVGVSTRK